MNAGSAASAVAPGGLRRVARVDLDALAINIRGLLELDADLVLDARADAYGHGLSRVVPLALELGVSTVRVSAREAAGAVALRGVRRSAIMTVPSVRTLVADAAFGLDGEGRPVLSLLGEVIAVKRAEAGAGVSYGYTYRTDEDTTLALVGLGYADGVPRLASNRASVSIGGTVVPIVGRIAMDQFVVDCGDLLPTVGDDVVLWGAASAGHPSVIDWARQTERTPLELTSGIGSRVERQYS